MLHACNLHVILLARADILTEHALLCLSTGIDPSSLSFRRMSRKAGYISGGIPSTSSSPSKTLNNSPIPYSCSSPCNDGLPLLSR